MLEKNDLDAIAKLLDARITETENRLNFKMSELEKRGNDRTDKKIRESESLLLDEMERLQKNMEKRMDKMQQNLDELNTYFRMMKAEKDSIQMLLQVTAELRKDVDELKSRIA